MLSEIKYTGRAHNEVGAEVALDGYFSIVAEEQLDHPPYSVYLIVEDEGGTTYQISTRQMEESKR